jgi:hypothetical protein
METYSVRAFAPPLGGAATNEAMCQLWNNSSTKRIRLLEFALWRAGTVYSRQLICRTTARGTPGSTVTPTANNAWSGEDVPVGDTLLDLSNFSVEPTIALPPLFYFSMNTGTGTEGMGFVWANPKGIWIKPGTGVAIIGPLAAVSSSIETYWVWDE